MPDQTQPSTDIVESQASSEVLALLAEDQAIDTTGQEEVTQEPEPVKTDDVDEDEATPPEESEEPTEGEEQKSEDEPQEDPEEEPKEDTEESQEFVVAGVKYTGLDKAIEAVNRISGDNSRLAGAVNSLEKQLAQKDEDIETLKAKVKEWQEYYDSDGEEEKPSEVDISEKVKQALREEKQREQEEQTKSQFRTELAELEQEKDYTVVLPHMTQLAKDLGESVKNVSPKKLYRMAKSIAYGDDSKAVLETAEKIAEQKVSKEINKAKAKNIIGGSARKSPTIIRTDDLSPEVEALLA